MKSPMANKQKGFTLVEVIVAMTIFSLLAGLLSISMINTQPRASLNSTIVSLTSDIKHQQLKAISGEIKDDSTFPYGIHFESNSYTLFAGNTFQSSDPTNFTVNLENNLSFINITFPGSSLVFSQNTGDVSGFTPGSNTITLHNSVTNEQKMLTVNRFGSVISVN